jgi:hypothetical protein
MTRSRMTRRRIGSSLPGRNRRAIFEILKGATLYWTRPTNFYSWQPTLAGVQEEALVAVTATSRGRPVMLPG